LIYEKTAVLQPAAFSANSSAGSCALARANPVFGADIKRIRAKNRIIDKSTCCVGELQSKITDDQLRHCG